MPGVLILKALVRVGDAVILSGEENRGKNVRFGGVKDARFQRKAIPGDILEMESRLTGQRGPAGISECQATVNGEFACTAELILP